jgi:hypothetical protein
VELSSELREPIFVGTMLQKKKKKNPVEVVKAE